MKHIFPMSVWRSRPGSRTSGRITASNTQYQRQAGPVGPENSRRSHKKRLALSSRGGRRGGLVRSEAVLRTV